MASRRIRRTKTFSSYLSALNQDISRIESKPRISGLSDGIVAGSALSSSVVLDNNFIQSGNYLPGLTGWKIDSNGVAEFSDIYVRGHIDAQTGSIGYWNISTPVVDRTFGGKRLFGTFLESRDLGISDNTQTNGSYVGLFKSYSEEGVAITHKYRFNNVATITAPDHGFENGDYVNITLEDDDVTFSTGESTVRIFNVTKDTFSYVNAGEDLTYVADGEYQDNFTYGTATLYVKDVAGLYLQDYGKALFDYGYFSNEGISYVSAETPNLVYNSSFEYEVGNGTFDFSNFSWISESDLTISAYNYSIDNIYAGDSYLGGQIEWTDTALSTYLHAQVNEAEFKRLDFYKNNRELYLNFDMFFKFPISKIAIPTTNSFFTTDSSIITITCPGHGLSVDDLVYFDFEAVASGYVGYTSYYRVHTVLSVDGDDFTVENKTGNTTSNPVTLSRRFTTSGPVIFKYTQPILDLNDIKISFVTGYDLLENPILDSSTSLFDVVTDVTAANWDYYRYWSHSMADFEVWYFNSDLYEASTYRPISSMGITALDLLGGDGSTKQLLNIKLSSSKIESYYRKLSPSSYYISDLEFYVSFPQWMWEGTESNASLAPIKREVKVISDISVGYILDNVSLSPSKKFFFGDSGSSSFYYKLTEDDQVKTNKVSYEAPRQWLDIDLDYQTAQLKYMDSIEFKSSDFLRQLYINPGINTVKSSPTVFGGGNNERILIGESSTLNITSGQYRYLSEDNVNYRTVEAFSSQETGNSSAIYQIKAVSSANPNINSSNSGAGGYLSVAVDSNDLGYIRGDADDIYLQAFSFAGLAATDGVGGQSRLTLGGSGIVDIESSLTSTSFQMNGSSGAGFIQKSDYSMVFGLTNDSPARVSALAIQSNELTSDYQSVYISTIDNTLGYVSSSIATKKNVEPLQLTLDSILAAEPVQFNYKSEEDGSPKHAGFIAEQLVEAGLGGYVSFDEDGSPKTVNYEMFVSALQSVVRYQASQITNLEDRITRLENDNV